MEGSSPLHLGAAELTVWASGGGAERDPEAKAITTIIILITRTVVIIIIIRILPACTQKTHFMQGGEESQKRGCGLQASRPYPGPPEKVRQPDLLEAPCVISKLQSSLTRV